MQARYYDAEVGQFASVDPIGPAPGNIYNINRYAYANNNPIRNNDPTGMHSASEGDVDKDCDIWHCQGNSSVVEAQRIQNLDNSSDAWIAYRNQFDIGKDAHKTLQTFARASSPYVFTERGSDGNGVYFFGRPDIGNRLTRELWEIKSATIILRRLSADAQLGRYIIASGHTYRAGGLPSFFHGSTEISLVGTFAMYNYQFNGKGLITYTYELKRQYRYAPIGRRVPVVVPRGIIGEIIDSIKSLGVEPIPVP
jgi:hypothetical protein